MIIKDANGFTAEVHLYDKDTGLDFVERVPECRVT
nr:MAG TPA: hypothetical protein [Caudoviricetes sp.]